MSPTNTHSAPLTVAGTVHFDRAGRGARKVLRLGPAPAEPEPGRVPRVARLMALAIRFDRLLRDRDVADQAALARLGHVTRARVSQIMSLLHLAPDIQEAVLFLAKVETGRAPLLLRDLLPIAATPDWKAQRALWRKLASRPDRDAE
ncbi:hypothetical protein [Gemmata sp.]|uniref:hypothetical protein n=1 Tax=Gemmata sp. TaxID=1914242 RepID=UPI003F714EA3